jgi:phosphoribosylformylglycinamidine cyclo-ligase
MKDEDAREKTGGMTYRDAGVDIDAQDEALARIKGMVRETFDSRVLTDIGAFGALYQPFGDGPAADRILVSSADGVGTKLKIAFLTGVHHTVGKDLVCHCVNDILVQGAMPMFFMDYLATGALDPDTMVSVVQGLVDGCKEARCALIGGETAEMPDFYGAGEYDLAGFIVGEVTRDSLLDGSAIRPGDVVLGLKSSGLHTNGYSLARKVLLDDPGFGPDDVIPELGCSVGEELLKIHRCYLKEVWPLVEKGLIQAMAHITGGGLTDNLPRVMPKKLRSVIKVGSWEIPSVFKILAERGEVPNDDLWRTFNMGVGMVLIVRAKHLKQILESLKDAGCQGFPMGNIVKGEGEVEYDHPPEGFPSGLR